MRSARWLVALTVGLVATVVVPGVAAGASPVTGSDISFPQCGHSYPAPRAFGIVGVNGGRPYTANPCFVAEYRWAQASGIVEFYVNTANPGTSDPYGYGLDAARDAYAYATARVSAGPGHLWWLDVETANSWSPDKGANAAVIAGALAFFASRGVAVGIYSTRYQWGLITGGVSIPAIPNWVPGAQSAAEAPSFCAARRSFTGGPVVMTQYTSGFDYDVICPGSSLPRPLPVAPPPLSLPGLLGAIQAWLRSL
jgi:hypothetical protein